MAFFLFEQLLLVYLDFSLLLMKAVKPTLLKMIAQGQARGYGLTNSLSATSLRGPSFPPNVVKIGNSDVILRSEGGGRW